MRERAFPTATTQTDGLSLDAASRLHHGVRRMMHDVVLSLLSCYDKDRHEFPASVHEVFESSHTSRDTAIVLTAIETSGTDVFDLTAETAHTSVRELVEDQDHRRSDSGFTPVPYQSYRDLVFQPSLKKIAAPESGTTVDDVLGAWPATSPPRPFVDRDAFTCARILHLLNLFNEEGTHREVYVTAADFVVQALAQAHAPHYAFGGVSLTGSEPHAFASFYAIQSMTGIAGILRKRTMQHERFAQLLTRINAWIGDPLSRTRLRYPTWKEDFNPVVSQELARIKDAVGLTQVVRAVEGALGHDGPDGAAIADAITEALGKQAWLDEFADLVKDQIRLTNEDLGCRLTSLQSQIASRGSTPAEGGAIAVPGGQSMKDARGYMACASLSWKTAFLEGTLHVLDQLRNLYKEQAPPRTRLRELARVFKHAAREWSRSEDLTRQYTAKFARWATAEINRQIALSSTPNRTNFDPAQLAFALRIHHDLMPRHDPQLIRFGLSRLMEAQGDDGCWPHGAPLVFDRTLMQATYVAHVEIINAVIPLVTEHGGLPAFYPHLLRVLQWLETNRVEVRPKGSPRLVSGWATERIPERARVDLWMTALALEFLDGFRELLESYLKDATCSRKYDLLPSRDLLSWERITDAALRQRYADRATTRIEELYIKPFREVGRSHHSSMLLYGPPGTAKTTLAKALAQALGWDLVTITPSDFVKEGIEKAEKMARDLFVDLLRLRRVVVLFDEIDEMLRSRSEASGTETSIAMLRFIVPGMLPKLQTLKQYGEHGRLIFVIATNYRERLDPAVTRRGRIDEEFMVLPPDEPSRTVILQYLLGGSELFRRQRMTGALQHVAHALAGITQGWVYRELDELARKVRRDVLDPLAGEENGEAVRRLRSDPPALLHRLEVQRPGRPFAGHEILGITRSLDLVELYKGRPKAKSEGREVLRICLTEQGAEPPDNKRVDEFWTEIVGRRRPACPRRSSSSTTSS